VFLGEVIEGSQPSPSVAYGQIPKTNGFHLMETVTDHWTENITGLAGKPLAYSFLFLM
jgi:hypothetical protein